MFFSLSIGLCGYYLGFYYESLTCGRCPLRYSTEFVSFLSNVVKIGGGSLLIVAAIVEWDLYGTHNFALLLYRGRGNAGGFEYFCSHCWL